MKPNCSRCSGSGVMGWLAPAAILILLPKCPACLALYLAVGTGIGLSFSAASYLRTAIIVTCAVWLLYAAYRYVSRFREEKRIWLNVSKR